VEVIRVGSFLPGKWNATKSGSLGEFYQSISMPFNKMLILTRKNRCFIKKEISIIHEM